MLHLNQRRSLQAEAAELALLSSGLALDATRDDSFGLVLYRRDEFDGEMYLCALAGIREPEPMFGPPDRGDYRRTGHDHPLGFRARENTSHVETVDRKNWCLFVNARRGARLEEYQRIRSTLVDRLDRILNTPSAPTGPLYPDLILQEHVFIAQMRTSQQLLRPGSSLEEAAKHITGAIASSFSSLLNGATPKGGSAYVGIYLETNSDWRLCGTQSIGPWLPDRVSGPKDPERNAFAWVAASGRSAFLGAEPSGPWAKRLQNCDELSEAIHLESFSGMCLAPIPNAQPHWRPLGVMLLIAPGRQLYQGHAYLLSRLALSVAEHLTPLLEVPGFPWMPDAKIQRGNANVRMEDNRESFGGISAKLVERAVRDLMPTGAEVRVSPLRAGHGGAQVFRLGVKDIKGIPEIPRVLKIGRQSIIQPEFQAYRRYVHNKAVGGAARIDIARGLHNGEHSGRQGVAQDDVYGAIVYTFVGSGEHAIRMSEWVKGASKSDLRAALDMLRDQLSCWHSRTQQADESAAELLLAPLEQGLKNYLPKNLTTDPPFAAVKDYVSRIRRACARDTKPSRTCVVHGDLHTDNMFVLLSPKGRLSSIALIDWAHVRSGRHALSDISKLMVDIAYRAQPTSAMRKLGVEIVREWAVSLGCGASDWKIALVHQLAKIMFYARSDGDAGYLDEEARRQAWEQMRELWDQQLVDDAA